MTDSFRGQEEEPPLAIDPELTPIAAGAWFGAHVLRVRVTGLWYLYGGPPPEGELAGFLEIGRTKEEARGRLRELVGDRPAGEKRLSVQELRSQQPGERL